MPRIVAYPDVLQALSSQGYQSLYYNSGAFGFDADVPTISRGWIGEPDPSIREAARAILCQVNPPVARQLSSRLIQVWLRYLAGPLWLMPRSHWAFELEYGCRHWLPQAMEKLGIDPRALGSLNTAPALEFKLDEATQLEGLLEQLLLHLNQSDFQLVFCDRQTICTIHSRRQLWWTTADAKVAAGLDRVLPTGVNENHGSGDANES